MFFTSNDEEFVLSTSLPESFELKIFPITSSFSIALIRTRSRWILANAKTDQGPEKGDLVFPGVLKRQGAFRESTNNVDRAVKCGQCCQLLSVLSTLTSLSSEKRLVARRRRGAQTLCRWRAHLCRARREHLKRF